MSKDLIETGENFILKTGHFFSWLNLILIFVILLQVILRYGFGHGLVILEELEWHLYAVAFMFGLSYALIKDSHVRVDIIYNKLSKKVQNIVDILGNLFLMLPFVATIIYYSWEFFYSSFRLNERSDAPLGLPCRWIIKSVVGLSFIMLGLAAILRIIRSIKNIKGIKNGSM
jgi:TRAP-type mannitol/chloroaromatic compound transport system permease small subunit